LAGKIRLKYSGHRLAWKIGRQNAPRYKDFSPREHSMNRKLLFLFALAAVLVCTPMQSADAFNGGGHGGGRGCGRGFGGIGFGIGGGGYGWDIAELYRELYNNLPYFALHPPVYYSEVVPRTYGYSPFAYPPGVMTPDLACAPPQPVTINNPYVPATKPATAPASTGDSDRAASVPQSPEPLVIINPYVTPRTAVAHNQK
jgi:hypothetical protein